MEHLILQTELQYKAIRSSGAGGQNVNKVSSKVVLNFDLQSSKGLSDQEKELLSIRLAPRLTNDLVLILHCDEDRSQLRNKELVTKRFFSLLMSSLTIQKPRKETKVPKEVIRKRLKNKKNISQLKQSRKKPDLG